MGHHEIPYTDAEAKAAAVQAGAITDGVTKAPTHDAVFDVKTTANAAIAKALLTTLGDIIRRSATVPERLGIGSTGQVLTVVAGEPAWAAAAAGDIGEGHILILGFNYESIGQGTWAIYVVANQFLNGSWRNTSNANGDNISYKVYLQAGTYTLRLLGHSSSSCAIVDIDINDTEVASFDLYTAAVTWNQVYSQTSITIATSGLYTLKFRVDGKNPSSDAYAADFTFICLWRTA